MKFAVVCLRRKGRPVPKWQLHREPRIEGQLTICDESDKALHRTVRVARIITVERFTRDALPPLFDATLLWMSNGQMALTGFERETTGELITDYAQTWLCEEAGQRS